MEEVRGKRTEKERNEEKLQVRQREGQRENSRERTFLCATVTDGEGGEERGSLYVCERARRISAISCSRMQHYSLSS